MGFQNQKNMPNVYQASDLFVLPSEGPGETWGLAINEAMASSKAVIASDKCGASFDLIQNRVNGYVFQSGNENMLSEKIKNTIESKFRLAEMGKESFRIIKNWSLSNICQVIEKSVIYL